MGTVFNELNEDVKVVKLIRPQAIPVIGVPPEPPKQTMPTVSSQPIEKVGKEKKSDEEKAKERQIMEQNFLRNMEKKMTPEEKLNYKFIIDEQLRDPQFSQLSKAMLKEKRFELSLQYMNKRHRKALQQKRQKRKAAGLPPILTKRERNEQRRLAKEQQKEKDGEEVAVGQPLLLPISPPSENQLQKQDDVFTKPPEPVIVMKVSSDALEHLQKQNQIKKNIDIVKGLSEKPAKLMITVRQSSSDSEKKDGKKIDKRNAKKQPLPLMSRKLREGSEMFGNGLNGTPIPLMAMDLTNPEEYDSRPRKSEKRFSDSYEQPMTVPSTTPSSYSGGYQYLNDNWLSSMREPSNHSTTSPYTPSTPYQPASSFPQTSSFAMPASTSSSSFPTSSSYNPHLSTLMSDAAGYSPATTPSSSSYYRPSEIPHISSQSSIPQSSQSPDASGSRSCNDGLDEESLRRLAEIDKELKLLAAKKREYEMEEEIKRREDELRWKEQQIALREREIAEREHLMMRRRSRSRSADRDRRYRRPSPSSESRHHEYQHLDSFPPTPSSSSLYSSSSSSTSSQRHRSNEISIARRDRQREERDADAARRHGQRSEGTNKRIGGRLSRKREERSSYYTDDNRMIIQMEDISDDE